MPVLWSASKRSFLRRWENRPFSPGSLPTSNNQARRSLSPPSGHQPHYTTQANLKWDQGRGSWKSRQRTRGKITCATATASIPRSLVSRVLLLGSRCSELSPRENMDACAPDDFFFLVPNWKFHFISFQESVYKMSKMDGKVGRERSLCSDWREYRPVQALWVTRIAWSPTPGFSTKSRPKCLWHRECVEGFSKPKQTEIFKSTSPPLLPVSQTPQRHPLGKIVRRALSITPNVKVKSNRKQLTDVCPAESVGVPGWNECRQILAYHRVAPFTPHYLAKNSLSLSQLSVFISISPNRLALSPWNLP